MTESEKPASGRDYSIQAVTRALKVVEFLAGGEILEWKSVREVAEGAGVPENTAFRILETLAAAGWAEKGPKGYRQSLGGLVRHAVHAQRILNQKINEHGDA